MIMPHPDSNLSLNLMVLGSELIKILKGKDRSFVIESAMEEFTSVGSERTPALFMKTLTYLYTVGAIELNGYNIKLKTEDGYTQLSLL